MHSLAGILKESASAFYSPQFYRRLAREGKGPGFLWMTVAALVSALFSALFLSRVVVPEVYNFFSKAPALMAQIPQITLQAGTLAIDRASPVIITLPGHPGLRAMIDTRLSAADIGRLGAVMEENNVFFIALKDGYAMPERRSAGGGVRIQSYLGKDSVTTQQELGLMGQSFSEKASWFTTKVSVLLVIAGLLFVWLYTFIATLLGGILTWVVNLGTKLDFSAALRVAAAARLPYAVLALGGFSPIIPRKFEWLLFLGYTLFAALSARRKEA